MWRPKDESYVVGLCERILGLSARRNHRFDFLRGDPGWRGRCAHLPVDAYYESLALVVEYHERQHFEPVGLFDRRLTVSGVTRREQRQLYEQRRRDQLPKHGIALVEMAYNDFAYGAGKRLTRTDADLEVVAARLAPFL